MDFLKSKGVEKFMVGEGTAGPEGDTMGAFEDYGYFALKDDFDVEFRNLNEDEWVPFEILDENLNPTTVRLARTYFHSYVVSVARMKTRVPALITLAIKNIAISCINNDDRHGPGPNCFSHATRPIRLNSSRIIQAVQPYLAAVDGAIGMEGRGPYRWNSRKLRRRSRRQRFPLHRYNRRGIDGYRPTYSRILVVSDAAYRIPAG